MNQLNENPQGGVTFYEGPHTYENELGQQYISVTTLIGKFKQKFNPREAAEKASVGRNPKYVGRSVEDIMAEWELAGSDARTRGTAFHKGKEDDHIKQALGELPQNSKGFNANPKMIIPVEGTGVMTDYRELPDGEYSELILWSHKYKLAGIADKVIIDGDYFDVEDYKTNKSIDMTSFYERGKGYKMLEWPLSDVMDCSYEVYQLQLSIYAYMFSELSGKIPRNLTILHHPTINGKPREEETRYKCKYQRHNLLLMLNMWGGYASPQFKESLTKNKLPDGL